MVGRYGLKVIQEEVRAISIFLTSGAPCTAACFEISTSVRDHAKSSETLAIGEERKSYVCCIETKQEKVAYSFNYGNRNFFHVLNSK